MGEVAFLIGEARAIGFIWRAAIAKTFCSELASRIRQHFANRFAYNVRSCENRQRVMGEGCSSDCHQALSDNK